MRITGIERKRLDDLTKVRVRRKGTGRKDRIRKEKEGDKKDIDGQSKKRK